MTAQEYKEKLDKAIETVEKKKATIERHKAQAEKKIQQIRANGWEQGIEDFEYRRADHDRYWLICEYEHKLEDIKSAEKKLKEAEEIAENWRAKYERQLDREMKIATEIPEAFKEARENLVNSWVEYDIERREKMLKARRELEYSEFRKYYTYTEIEELTRTDEQFRKIESAEADMWLLDLYNRVVAITGKITDARNIRWGGKCLDGFVIGENGKAYVQTISAGGYNIQRWHLRTLVQEYK